MYQLGVEGKSITLEMDTTGSTHHAYIPNQETPIYTKDKMPVSKKHIPTSHDRSKWTHLNGSVLPKVDADLIILIGNNVMDACATLEVRTCLGGAHYMSRSILGDNIECPKRTLQNS